MEIENTSELPDIKRGRPIIYPFDKIGPGQNLTIPASGSPLKEKRLSVANSLNYYKKQNSLTWTSLVSLEGENIVVYRIN